MQIEKKHVSALVVDMQERLFPHIYEHEEVATRTVILIKGLRILEVPLIVTQQYTKGLGATIQPIADALGDFEALEKMSFSCCSLPAVETPLLGSKGHQMIVMGIEAHICVQQTVLDIQSQGRMSIVIEDCVSSRRENDKRMAIERMRAAGAIITTSEALLFELLEEAGSDKFKQISALVK